MRMPTSNPDAAQAVSGMFHEPSDANYSAMQLQETELSATYDERVETPSDAF